MYINPFCNPIGEVMECPNCDQPIDFPVRQSIVRSSGEIVTRAVCTKCSRSKFDFDQQNSVDPLVKMVSTLREISAYIRLNGRWPTMLDWWPKRVYSSMLQPMEEMDSHELDRKLRFIDALAEFIESNERMPSPAELPGLE